MFIRAGKYLGLDTNELKMVRLASLGAMLPIGDHSFYEIMSAAQAVDPGLQYLSSDPAKGYKGYRDIDPITTSDIKSNVSYRGVGGGRKLEPAAL